MLDAMQCRVRIMIIYTNENERKKGRAAKSKWIFSENKKGGGGGQHPGPKYIIFFLNNVTLGY